MGSGKSTIGSYLANQLNLQFIDLDEYIERRENLSIDEIFRVKGEIYFRLQESKYLKEFINNNKDYILSLGGGTPCYGNNIEVLKSSNVVSFYLKASIKTLKDRLQNGKVIRPLIKDLNPNELNEFIGKHLFERTPFYEQAQLKVIVDNKTIEQIYCDITAQLQQKS